MFPILNIVYDFLNLIWLQIAIFFFLRKGQVQYQNVHFLLVYLVCIWMELKKTIL